MNTYLNNNDNSEFINAFKKTSYYQELFNNYEIVCMFLLGSRCVGIIDEISDYDIAIITLNGDYIDISKDKYLTYKGVKVHWYFRPIKEIFSAKNNHLDLLCSIQLRNVRDDLIIYENPNYKSLLSRLCKVKNKLSTLGIYRLFEVELNYINDILSTGEILEKHYRKTLYHLCTSSYYLLEEEINKDFLRELKRIKEQPVSDEYKQLAIKRLKLYKDYIEAHPIDFKIASENLLKELLPYARVHN